MNSSDSERYEKQIATTIQELIDSKRFTFESD